MNDISRTQISEPVPKTSLARVVLFSFLLTFMAARVVVYLIMSRRIPDLYLYLGGTHVHHLNYGIFLLSGLGAYLLFKPAEERNLNLAAILYGCGMALTYDEFGMWIRLGGSYWQRASLDAIGVLAGLFGLLAYAPALKKFRPRHWWSALIILVGSLLFFWLLAESFKYAGKIIGPRLYELEATSSPVAFNNYFQQ